ESIESVETEEPVVVEEPMETVVIAIEEDVQVETATRMPIAPVAAPMLEPEPVAAPMLEPEPVAAPVAEPVAVPEQIAEPVSTPVITEQVAEPVPATVYYDKVWVERIFDEMFDDGTIVPDFIDLAGMSRQRPVDIAWRVDGILGGIKVYRVDETVSLNELAGTYVEWLRPNCQGNFSENLSPISDNVMTADAICGTDDSMAALALRRNGDTLAIVFHEGQGMETIDYVRKLRDALATYMVE
ncbi:MAG: hypothetical protein U9N14_02495, partial [Pseudomonadota bacterium]|nr:hypothetical protein [Pseudomonadota bacterium]